MFLHSVLYQALFIVILLINNIAAMPCGHKLPRGRHWWIPSCCGTKIVPEIDCPTPCLTAEEQEELRKTPITVESITLDPVLCFADNADNLTPSGGEDEARRDSLTGVSKSACDYKEGELWQPETLMQLEAAFEDLYDYVMDVKDMAPNPTVIFDIDGTILISKGFRRVFRLDCVLCFYQKLIEAGVNCVFLTARNINIANFTQGELRALGYNKGRFICLPDSSIRDIGKWKMSERVKLSEKLTILATLDDQAENLVGDCLGVALRMPEISFEILEQNPLRATFFKEEVECRACPL